MNLDFTPFFVLGALLTLCVIAMVAWRKVVARAEDDTLHVLDARMSTVWQQADIAHRLDAIDRWGKILTAVTAAYLVLLGVLFMYDRWLRASNLGPE